jgi:hypothetical protein
MRFSEPVLRNFTEHLLAYAIGRRAEYYDQPTVRAIVKQARRQENRFSAFVIGVVNSAAFQMVRADVVPSENTSLGHPANDSRR